MGDRDEDTEGYVTDTVGYQLGRALGPQGRGCIGAVIGFIAFIVSPLWAIASSQSLPTGQEERGYDVYFIGLGVGLLAGIPVVWDAWRRLKNPALRKPMRKSTFYTFWLIGYIASSFIEREVVGTLWGPFLIGVFGTLGLWFIPVSFISNPTDEEEPP